MQYGGPALLDICHRAIGFPSSSTCYRMLRKLSNPLLTAVDTKAEDFISNFNPNADSPIFSHMLKITETYVDPRVRWNPQDNKLYGLCYEHGQSESLEFNTCSSIENLASMVREGKLHIPKECMVLAIGSNSIECSVQIVAALPTCTKNEIDFQCKLIETLSNDIVEMTGAPFLNWATDGDATRRQIFDKLMCWRLNESSSLFGIISRLKLIDCNVGRYEETVNYDPKHLAKRLRNTLIGTLHFGNEHLVTASDMTEILSCHPNNSSDSTKSMINPEGKQNVAIATEMLMQFCDSVEDVSLLKRVSFRVCNVSSELHLLRYVIEGVLAMYCKIDLSIKEALEAISTAAHVLFVLQRTLIKFIPNQLYHDLQATFEDAFYCANKWQIAHANEPFFLMLLGNDPIERAFGNIRLKYRHCSVDNLELINASRAMEYSSKILSKHSEWTGGKRAIMRRLALDYCNPRNLNAQNQILLGVDIIGTWNVGRANAEKVLNKFERYGGNTSQWGQPYGENGTSRHSHAVASKSMKLTGDNIFVA